MPTARTEDAMVLTAKQGAIWIWQGTTVLVLVTALSVGCHRRGESVRYEPPPAQPTARAEPPGLTRAPDDRLPVTTPRGETYPAGPAAPAMPMAPNSQARPAVRDHTVVLTGAAALLYLYNQHQTTPERLGHDGKWYLSPKGHVYWLDPHRHARQIQPPQDGIEVTVEEGQKYRMLQGYANRSTGRGLSGLGRDPEP
jgi:hypothetical protein